MLQAIREAFLKTEAGRTMVEISKADRLGLESEATKSVGFAATFNSQRSVHTRIACQRNIKLLKEGVARISV